MMILLHPAAYVRCADQIPQRSHIDEAQRWDPTGKTLFRYLAFARRRGGVCLVLWCGGCQGDSSFSDIQQEMWGSLCEGIVPQKCLNVKVEKGKKNKRHKKLVGSARWQSVGLIGSRRWVQKKPQDVRGFAKSGFHTAIFRKMRRGSLRRRVSSSVLSCYQPSPERKRM